MSATSSSVTVSSSDTETLSPSRYLKLIFSRSAFFRRVSAAPAPRSERSTVSVSKNEPFRLETPMARSPRSSLLASAFILLEMRRSPSGPWYTAYMDDIMASSDWAVHMFDVAFSLRMCCSLV